MSAKDSYLSAPQFGFDVVVAVTQASINATMKAYLATLKQPVVSQYYVADESGNPAAIEREALLSRTGGVDPFSIPPGVDVRVDPRFQRLQEARFMTGFRARIGLPQGLEPLKIPDVVVLGTDTSAVTYNLMCEQFSVVQYVPGGGYAPATWRHDQQQPGAPWIFTSKVDLRLSKVEESQYGTLPPDVREALKNLGEEAFSVQQLLLDLNTARLQSTPEIVGLAPGTDTYMILQKYFLGAYFKSLSDNGDPVLGYSMKATGPDRSSLRLTDLSLEVCPLLGPDSATRPTREQQRFATLNYLCAVQEKPLPPATRFNWNWVETSEGALKHGVVAVCRTTFAAYFLAALREHISANCYKPFVQNSMDGATIQWTWHMTRGQEPNITMSPTGARVIEASYSASHEADAGVGGMMAAGELRSSYKLTVDFSGTTIKISQCLVVYLRVRSGTSVADGHVINKELTDTYNLAVSKDGDVTATLESTEEDRAALSKAGVFSNLLGNVNEIAANVTAWLSKFTHTSLTHIPVSAIQRFIFPGGRTFAFKSVAFSEHQDLVCDITYADPSNS